MVRDRFAPSPTGYVHLGSLRTALYNYLYAKKSGGQFILRLEDTDRSRYEKGSTENMLEVLIKTGIVPDEGLFIEDTAITEHGEFGPYIQSQRLDIYKAFADELIQKEKAYYCFCTKDRLEITREEQRAQGMTPKYDGHCRNIPIEEAKKRIADGEEYVIRLKLPEEETIGFDDVVRGHIEVNSKDLDDQVLIKGDGFPTYHFAVVIDDYLMEISHVIRGEEWLPSTPKHVYLYECFGWDAPIYVHLPNILNTDHKKLSKRQGDVAVEDFLNKGYPAEALINYLALLGWSPEGDNEFFTLDELVDAFDLQRINKSGAVFDIEKLNWMSAHYIKELTAEEALAGMKPFFLSSGCIEENDFSTRSDWLLKISELLKERISFFAQAEDEVKKLFSNTFEINNPEALEIMKADSVPVLHTALIEKISELDALDRETAMGLLKEIQKEHKAEKIKGKMLYMPTRIMITGEMHGPDLALIMDILGKDEVLARLSRFGSMLH